MYYDAKTKKISALNGSGRSPKALNLAKARELGLNGIEIPLKNLNSLVFILPMSLKVSDLTILDSVTVPGCAAAWCDTIELLGSGKITIADALAPAIRQAEGG